MKSYKNRQNNESLDELFGKIMNKSLILHSKIKPQHY